MAQLRSHCHQIVVMRLIKSQSARLTTNASFWIMVFLHLLMDTTKLEVPSMTPQTHKQVGVSKCLHFFGFSNHSFWETLQIFSSVQSTQMVTILRQSIVTRSFSTVVPPLPPLIWTLSRRITARQRNFVAFCILCSKYYLLLVSCGKAKFFCA